MMAQASKHPTVPDPTMPFRKQAENALSSKLQTSSTRCVCICGGGGTYSKVKKAEMGVAFFGVP